MEDERKGRKEVGGKMKGREEGGKMKRKEGKKLGGR